jgi:hypothetical protein
VQNNAEKAALIEKYLVWHKEILLFMLQNINLLMTLKLELV